MHLCDALARYYTQGSSQPAELCRDGRFIMSNLRLLFLPPVDASVSKATSMMAWALSLQASSSLATQPVSTHMSLQDVAYGHITRSKPSGFFGVVKSEKQYLTLHASNQLQFSFRFSPVAGVAAVDVARLKTRLDESLAVIQDLSKRSQQQRSDSHHRASLPPLPSQTATPVPYTSSLHGPPHPMPLANSQRRVESALVFAPALPLPRCTCICACHCMQPPISPTAPRQHLISPPSSPRQVPASYSTCARPSLSPAAAHTQPRLPP
jgi:hypothetical protein